MKRGRFAKARADAELAIALTRAPLPEGALAGGVGLAQLTLGEALAGERRTAEARAALDAALRHLDVAVGATHPATVRARAVRARL